MYVYFEPCEIQNLFYVVFNFEPGEMQVINIFNFC